MLCDKPKENYHKFCEIRDMGFWISDFQNNKPVVRKAILSRLLLIHDSKIPLLALLMFKIWADDKISILPKLPKTLLFRVSPTILLSLNMHRI